MIKSLLCSALILAGGCAERSPEAMFAARRDAGEVAIEAACSGEGFNSRDSSRALDYIEIVRRDARPGELSRFIGDEVWRSCLATQREGHIRGQVALVLLEKGTEDDVRLFVEQVGSPSLFCRTAAGAYGPTAAPRIDKACGELGFEPSAIAD